MFQRNSFLQTKNSSLCLSFFFFNPSHQLVSHYEKNQFSLQPTQEIAFYRALHNRKQYNNALTTLRFQFCLCVPYLFLCCDAVYLFIAAHNFLSPARRGDLKIDNYYETTTMVRCALVFRTFMSKKLWSWQANKFVLNISFVCAHNSTTILSTLQHM